MHSNRELAVLWDWLKRSVWPLAYGLGVEGTLVRLLIWGKEISFLIRSIPLLRSTQPPMQWVPGSLKATQDLKLTNQSHPLPKIRTHGSITPFTKTLPWRAQESYNRLPNLPCPRSGHLVSIHSLVFRLRGRVGRNQSPVMWPVWLWHTASWASTWG